MNEEANHDCNGDESLYRLIRECHGDNETFHRPSDEAIEAYMYGNPTQAQKREVRTAMTSSEEFRREILEKCEEVDALASPKVRDAFDSAVVDAYPDFENLKSGTSSVARTATSFIPMRWVVSSAAAALLVVTAAYIVNYRSKVRPSDDEIETGSTQTTTSTSATSQSAIKQFDSRQFLSLTVHTAKVEKSLLIESIVLRSAESLESQVDSSAFDSAIRSFAKALALDSSGDFRPVGRRESRDSIVPSGELFRKIVIGYGSTESSRLRFGLPTYATDVRIWVLSLPSRSLSFSDQIGDSLEIDPGLWQKSDEVFVTFTYSSAKKCFSTAALQISL